jgi:hypothetical protein
MQKPTVKEVNVNYLGMYGYGPTKREATDHAKQRLAAAMEGSYYPRPLLLRTLTVIVFRTPTDYGYFLIRPDEAPEDNRCIHGGYGSWEEAERSARVHAAQNLMNVTMGDAAEEVITDPGDRKQQLEYLAWQQRYRAWIKVGRSDHDAHELASMGVLPQDTISTLPKVMP